jgi:hypothetical protein
LPSSTRASGVTSASDSSQLGISSRTKRCFLRTTATG